MSAPGLRLDVTVGRMVEGTLSTEVSLRGGTVVIAYKNTATARGFEVSYSPTAAENFNDLVASAVKVARGIVS